jgi:hypothetical protein
MDLMRLSDSHLLDDIYTDENLLGTDTVIEKLPSFPSPASPIASLEMFAAGHNSSLGVTTESGAKTNKVIANIGESHVVALSVTSSHNMENGGSGGARTRTKSNVQAVNLKSLHKQTHRP